MNEPSQGVDFEAFAREDLGVEITPLFSPEQERAFRQRWEKEVSPKITELERHRRQCEFNFLVSSVKIFY